MGLKFKSQIATTREQSEKLIALGLKPGTADMYLEKCRLPEAGDYYLHTLNMNIDAEHWFSSRINRDIIPAWSLSRLLEMMPKQIRQMNRPYADLDINSDGQYWFVSYEELGYDLIHQEMRHDLFDSVISMIAWLIDNGHFDKGYLKED